MLLYHSQWYILSSEFPNCIFKQNTGCTPIALATNQGNREIVEKLFSLGADVNIPDKV